MSMADRFEVEARDRLFQPRRLWVLPLVCLALAAIHALIDGHGHRPMAWAPILREAIAFLLFMALMGVLILGRELLALELDGTTLTVHRISGAIPVIGRLFRPLTLPRTEWRLAVERRELLIGRASGHPDFRWGSTRRFRCSERTASRLGEWLAARRPRP